MSTPKPNNSQSNNQNISMGNVNIQGGSFSVKQNNNTSSDQSSVTNQKEFIDELANIINKLTVYQNTFPDAIEAIKDIQSARAEANKSAPNPSIIRRFLNNAKTIVEEIAGGVTDISTIAVSIAALSKLALTIFGG